MLCLKNEKQNALFSFNVWILGLRRTSIIIAHRLSTIKHSDSILVVRDGRIIENGSHEQLLNEKGFYYTMWFAQQKKQNVEHTS